MKRSFIIIIVLFFVSVLSYGQIYVDDNYVFSPANDSTEFAFMPTMVTDSIEVSRVVNEYKQRKKQEYKEQLDLLGAQRDSLTSLQSVGNNGKLSLSDGTYNTYERLVKDLALNTGYAPSFRESSAASAPGTNPRDGSSWLVRYKHDVKKIERLMNKKQTASPIILEYANWICLQLEGKIAEYKQLISDLNKGSDFSRYQVITNSTVFPKKQSFKRVDNPYYVAPINVNYRGKRYYQVAIDLEKRDLINQVRGWRWVIQGKHRKEWRHYPHHFLGKYYDEHPEYIVVVRRVFDAEGNLVRVFSLGRGNGELSDILKELHIILCQKDFFDNKYSVLSNGPDVQYAIARELEISCDRALHLMSLYENGASANSRYNLLCQNVAAYNRIVSDYSSLLDEWASLNKEQAVRFKQQVLQDHENDFQYILEINRVSATVFRILFSSEDLKPTLAATVEFIGTEPFKAKWAIKSVEEL